MRGDHTTFSQRRIQQLKIWLLEQRLGRSIRVGGIGNDDVELVLLVFEEFEAIANVNFDGGMLEANGHSRKVFLGQADDGFVNVAEDGFFDGFVLYYFAEDAAVSTAYDEHLFRIGMRIHRKVRDHFLIAVACGLVPSFAVTWVVELTRTHRVRCIV